MPSKSLSTLRAICASARRSFIHLSTSGFVLCLSLLILSGCGSGGGGNPVPQTGASTAAPVPAVSLSASSITFPSTLSGSVSGPQTVTITDSGTAPLTLSSVAFTGPAASLFSDTTTCGATLAVGASCTVTTIFSPLVAGSYAAAIALTDSAGNSPQSIPITATSAAASAPAAAAAISLSASSITFPSLVAGSVSSPQTVTITDSGTAPVTLSSVALTGSSASLFSDTTTCGMTLAVGASCTVTTTFSPLVAGSYAAAISLTDSAGNSPQSIPIAATAFTSVPASTPAVSLSTSSITFPSIVAGSVSAAQTVTLTDSGTAPLTLSSVTLTGSAAGLFSDTTTCGATLAVGASCTVTTTFRPLAAGSFTAAITLADSAGNSPQAIPITAAASTGALPVVSLSAPSITFPSLIAGTVSGAQSVTITNSGTAPLNVFGVALTGPGANLFSDTTTCGATLAVGASCTVTTTFSPLVPSSYTAAITLSDSAGDSPQSIPITATASGAALTIDTTVATDWKISNGTLNIDWNSQSGRVYGITLAGFPDQLVDVTTTSAGQPEGLYMDNSGFGSGTTSATYTNNGNYLDWSITTASNAANAYTYTEHFVITPNDPGIHVYFVANHATTDIAGSISQVQWVYRENLNDFTNTYSVNADLSNPGPVIVPLPPASEDFSLDPGRDVSNATVDLHGFTLPAGFTREFYTKYDYSSYNYLHQAHGVYGSNIGVWGYFPSNESLVGGPTKQNLIYTGNLLILEAFSNHYDLPLALNTAAGTASSRLFGPFYVHFNTIGQAYNTVGNTLQTPADMYQDALQAGATFSTFYDNEQQLLQSGYVPSTARGTVSVQITGVAGAPKTAWAVLSDPNTNFQFSCEGSQYWADLSSTGSATFTGVIPGTYRLSVYVLGQWGELRQDNIVVTANQVTTVPTVAFVPENFGTTVFTIGTADRSSHEFLHGHDAAGHDDREFWGTFNYWADFQSTNGSVVYNATSGPAGAATNDPTKWNYDHWGTFDPGLYGGVYNATDDTPDGYTYVIPPYVAGLSGATGTNGVSTRVPDWQVHFATPANVANYQYAVISVALACNYGSYVLNLNGTARTWAFRSTVETDCAVRSGLSGYTQWIAFQFPIASLSAAGLDNLLTINASQTYGAMDDAIRLELTNQPATPSTTGWNDYEFVSTSSTSNNIQANDSAPNP